MQPENIPNHVMSKVLNGIVFTEQCYLHFLWFKCGPLGLWTWVPLPYIVQAVFLWANRVMHKHR